ncbi:hypothetical protein FACS1894219_08200 [Clostridia bacterium]|nr:hypothetical protein FACS1894219_08200 [Clostridia bacterium]
MSEIIIKLRGDGTVAVEDSKDGVKGFKEISPNSLLECINKSLLRGVVSSGLLPKGCLSFTAHDSGDKYVVIIHSESRADISYYGTQYPDFPLPKLVFGFSVTRENRISRCRLGVVGNENNLKPSTSMFLYPFSNVSGTSLCTGNNVLPKCESLHTLSSVPHYILSMDNNNDHFKPTNNKQGFEMRDLLELLRDKAPEYYYTDVLIPAKFTLADFINERG